MDARIPARTSRAPLASRSTSSRRATARRGTAASARRRRARAAADAAPSTQARATAARRGAVRLPSGTRTGRSGPRHAVVVLGVDFSQANEAALESALRVAKDWDGHVVLVHALKPLAAPGLDLSHPPFDPVRNETADVTMGAQPALADSWVARFRAAGVRAELVNRPGPAAEVIIDEARRRKARVIVVGTHGRSGVEKAMLGSVANEVLAKSPIPVLVVPGTAVAA